MSRGKHSSGRMHFFNVNSHGKHSRNDIVVYNPIYAKINSCLSSLVIATSLMTVATLGRFKGTLASSDTARVAKYKLELLNTETSITEFIPNTTQNINFQIKNYDSTTNNEVKLKYRIILDTPVNPNLPVTYKLYRKYSEVSEEEITLTNGISNYIEVDLVDTTHYYRLEITWPSQHDSILYQNLTDNIRISVDSEQID